MIKKFEGESGADYFFKQVWVSDGVAVANLLKDKGYSEEEIRSMFERGTIMPKLKEVANNMTAEERYGFWSMNC